MLGDEELCRVYHENFFAWYAQRAYSMVTSRPLVHDSFFPSDSRQNLEDGHDKRARVIMSAVLPVGWRERVCTRMSVCVYVLACVCV